MVQQAHCCGQRLEITQHHDIAMRMKRMFEVEKVRGNKRETFAVKAEEGKAEGGRIYR